MLLSERGVRERDPSLGSLQISAGGLLAIGEGPEARQAAQLLRPMLALYIGGMGAKGRNFYSDVACRYGYESEAAEIQDLYLSGKKEEAAAVVPGELLEAMSLCGPESFVLERIAAFKEAGVTHLQVEPIPTGDQTKVSLVARLRELVD